MTQSLNNLDPLTELQLAFSMLEDARGPAAEYRIHYDQLGHITGRSHNGFSESGMYLIVTQEEYDNYYQYEAVKDNVLIKKPKVSNYSNPLVKNEHGWRVAAGHAGIVLNENETYPHIENYGYRNN